MKSIISWKHHFDQQFKGRKNEFIQEQYFSTLFILRGFGVILIILLLALFLYIDLPVYDNTLISDVNAGIIQRDYLWAIMLGFQMVFTALASIKSPKTTQDIGTWHKFLVFTDSLFVLIWAAAISANDQVIHGDITVYVIVCFAVAAATQFTPSKNIIIYTISFIFFYFGIQYFQADPARQAVHYVNGLIEVIMALVITLILFRTRVRSFLYRKTIEQQKNEMELRVRERTVDLAMANEELRAEIVERRIAEEKMTYLSLHDPLTDLYNRAYFEEEMHRLEHGRKDSLLGLIVCDVDGLKLINDTMGHDKGDSFLIAAAEVLKTCFRFSDVVSRVGGDEFAILLPDATREIVEEACIRLQDNVTRHNESTEEFPLSISVGSAVRTDSSVPLSEMYKEADNNMYREKLYRSQSARSAIVQTLMRALEARDFITEGHAERLQDMVAEMGAAMSLPTRNIVDLRLLAQFHDIGKVGLPDRILFKPGPLTPEERVEMQRHSEIGHRIALSSPDFLHISDWVLKHHEWWDGNGYPLGMSGEDIPLECRILAIADAYDAMTSDRPYRKAMCHDDAMAELKACAGKQFDPELVDKFNDVLNKMPELYHAPQEAAIEG
ncbi:MAG: diguanylate cyclase domain-containing protein [Ignavibacteriales bacterium]